MQAEMLDQTCIVRTGGAEPFQKRIQVRVVVLDALVDVRAIFSTNISCRSGGRRVPYDSRTFARSPQESYSLAPAGEDDI